jgi:integrase/recombinase XerC
MDMQNELTASLTRYLTYLAGRNVSEHTRVAYRTDLSQFFNYLMENDITVDGPEKITATHISDFLSHLSGLGRSGVTRVRKLAAIREYLKFLVDVEKLLPSSPAEKMVRPKKERKQRVFLRVDEYMRLLGSTLYILGNRQGMMPPLG